MVFADQPAVPSHSQSLEQLKSKLTERLAKLEVMAGVLPTPVARSEGLVRMARSIRKGNIELAEKAAAAVLKVRQSAISAGPATAILSGSSALRAQMAGFAEAGLTFFHSRQDIWNLAPAERRTRGGNGMVSRVLVAQQRILLETSRIIIRFAPDAMAARKS